jgi:predicted metal-dependent peptidase
MSQRGWGSLPSGLRQAVDDLIEPKLDWRQILSKWLGERGHREDYSYRRPNRRSQDDSVTLPSLSAGRADVAVIIDTSGSMTGEPLKEIVSEVQAVVEELRCTSIFLSCDAQVHDEVHEPEHIEQITEALGGGGGSDLRPAFDKLAELNFTGPVIAATDGWITVPDVKPLGQDVMWLMPTFSADEPPAQYGEELRVPIDEKYNPRRDKWR